MTPASPSGPTDSLLPGLCALPTTHWRAVWRSPARLVVYCHFFICCVPSLGLPSTMIQLLVVMVLPLTWRFLLSNCIGNVTVMSGLRTGLGDWFIMGCISLRVTWPTKLMEGCDLATRFRRFWEMQRKTGYGLTDTCAKREWRHSFFFSGREGEQECRSM